MKLKNVNKFFFLMLLLTFTSFHCFGQIESRDICLEENLECYELCLNKFDEDSEDFKSCYSPCEKKYFECNENKAKELESFENEKYKIGDIVPEYNLRYLIPCRKGLCIVKFNGKIGFVDLNRKLKIPFRYDDAAGRIDGYIQNGLLGLKYKGKWGFVDLNNEVVIPFKYEAADAFSNIASVKYEGKWGYIDTLGNTILPFKYDRTVSPWKRGKGRVVIGREYFTVDNTGKCVENCKLYEKSLKNN